MKHDGSAYKAMSYSDIKQIAGRAGRYRTAADASKNHLDDGKATMADGTGDGILGVKETPNVGLVTCLANEDMERIRKAMASTPGPLTTAGILPPDHIIIQFASYFPPRTPLSYIFLRLQEISRMNSRFRLCSLRDKVRTADIIQSIDGLTIQDRLVFCAAPVPQRDPYVTKMAQAYARCVSQQSGGALLDIEGLHLEILDKPNRDSPGYLASLESLHSALVLYLWLSYRFNGVFVSQAMAMHVKRLVEKEIDQTLVYLSQRAAAQYKPGGSLKKILKELFDQEQGRKTTKGQKQVLLLDKGPGSPNPEATV